MTPLVSASQINQWDDCERKWGWKYIAKIPQPDTPASALGTECDDTQLQPYLRDDRPIDYSRPSGYIVAAGLAFLPKPKTLDLEVQKHFVMPSPTDARFGYQGFIDLWLPHGMPEATEDEGPCLPNVRDFKTTGNWKYAKTPEQLKTDTQAQLYATWAMWKTGARVVDLDWIYFATKGAPKSKRVHLRVTSDHVAEQFSRIDATAVRMFEARSTITDPLELKPNAAMCEAYGGCPYRSNCNLSPGEKVDAAAAKWLRDQEKTTMAETGTLSLLERMKAQKAAAAGVAPVASPAAAAPTAPAVTAAGIPVENLPAWATAPVDPRKPLGINPPEKDLPPAVATLSTPPTQTLQPAIHPDADVGQIAADRGVAAVEAPKRRGPGRPKKDPLGADAAMHTAMKTAGDALVQSLERAEIISDTYEPGDYLLESVSVTWAEETFCPVAYNPFKVGPFEATGFVQKGETVATASARIYAELVTFAETARTAKAVSFRAMLGGLGGGK